MIVKNINIKKCALQSKFIIFLYPFIKIFLEKIIFNSHMKINLIKNNAKIHQNPISKILSIIKLKKIIFNQK